MNILRVSTLSLTLVVAAFALSYNPSFADRPDPEHSHGGDDGEEVTYSVTISGDVDGQSGDDNWVGGFAGKNSIGLNDAPPDELDVGGFTNLNFFTLESSPFGPEGAICFGTSTTIHQAVVKRGKGGRAEATFWFDGRTRDNADPVGYSLHLFGMFNPDIEWLPVNDTHDIVMMDWRTGVTNVGQNIKSRSCIGEGEEDDDFTVAIFVNPE